eukprot:2834316-Amphidinium_carterae.1
MELVEDVVVGCCLDAGAIRVAPGYGVKVVEVSNRLALGYGVNVVEVVDGNAIGYGVSVVEVGSNLALGYGVKVVEVADGIAGKVVVVTMAANKVKVQAVRNIEVATMAT